MRKRRIFSEGWRCVCVIQCCLIQSGVCVNVCVCVCAVSPSAAEGAGRAPRGAAADESGSSERETGERETERGEQQDDGGETAAGDESHTAAGQM